MFEHRTNIRVRYGETDQMGFVYYGNYGLFYEVGRTEAIRALGLSYKALEDSGVMMPVIEFQIKYLRPAHYDDLITIVTKVEVLPQQSTIEFVNELYNEKGKMLNTGKVVLAFVSKETGRKCEAPALLLDKLKPYFHG